MFSRVPVKDYEEKTLSDGADIIAIVKNYPDSRLKIVLEIIYRIPVEKYIIQLPAGMVDPHETDIVACA